MEGEDGLVSDKLYPAQFPQAHYEGECIYHSLCLICKAKQV